MHMRFADDLAVPACLSDCLHHTLCFDHDNDPVPQIKPPFVPEQNINAAAQDSIGVFEDTKVRVAPEDQRRYEGWQTVDKHAVQAEFIEFLAWEQYNVRGWRGGGGRMTGLPGFNLSTRNAAIMRLRVWSWRRVLCPGAHQDWRSLLPLLLHSVAKSRRRSRNVYF